LDEYGIPTVPVVEGDSIMKTYRKGKAVSKENRGDAIPKTE
jgi:mxaJ protein